MIIFPYHKIIVNLHVYSMTVIKIPVNKAVKIHEHNTRGCQLVRELTGAKSFSDTSVQIWNVLTNKIYCEFSKLIFKCNLKRLFVA